jgi:hypothetical protein
MKTDYFYVGLVISLRCFCSHALILWNLPSPCREHLRIGQLYFLLLMHRRRSFIGVICKSSFRSCCRMQLGGTAGSILIPSLVSSSGGPRDHRLILDARVCEHLRIYAPWRRRRQTLVFVRSYRVASLSSDVIY